MAGKGVEITIQILYVCLHMRRGLGTVDDGDGTDSMGFGDDFLNGTLHAKDVADSSKGDDFRFVINLSQIFVCKMAFFVEVHVFQYSPRFLADTLPCDQIRMVFRNRNDDFVTFFKARFGIAAGNQVEGFCRIAHKDDFFG